MGSNPALPVFFSLWCKGLGSISGKHSVYSRQVKPGKGGKCEIGIRNLS